MMTLSGVWASVYCDDKEYKFICKKVRYVD